MCAYVVVAGSTLCRTGKLGEEEAAISNSGKTLSAAVYLWFSVVCKLLAVARQVSRAAVSMLSTGGPISAQTMLKPAVKATGSTHSCFLSGNSLRSLNLQCSAPNATRQVSEVAKGR